ncbi:hypothetical protein AG0111_0g7901 [Alternaria gaisen]|uniref:Uncharacterized protein n=1 Tax=Alternaria gaisen TaxID=167740 RepID=A0ACB6FJ02_9PLEO|nr:hypothetical protein AG0111_0g7901 [Alternaria gaisen]
MDPLSVAGSIAGLISLSDTIFRKLYHYVKDVKSAEKEVQELKNEVAALNGVLHNLHLVAEDLETSSLRDISIRPDHINSCLATLYQLDDRMNKAGIFDKGKIRATIHKLSWPFKSVNAKKFIDDIRSHRDHLNFALSADTMTALLQCLSKQDQLLSSVAGLEKRLRDKQNIDTKIFVDEKRQEILDSFLSINPDDSFRTNTRIRHATTGFWLTETEEFIKWMQGSNLHLWLSGIPGAGKTILSSLIIQQCLKEATDDRAVAFFYCDYKNIRSQDVVQILSSLASQLARQHESSFQLLKGYDNKIRPQNQLRRSPEVEELVDLLRKMSDLFEDVRLIVDGLDECTENAGEVANTLRSLGDGHAVISLCLLSRDEIDIRAELEDPMFGHIEIAAHTEDIEHYVRTEIEERLKRKKLRLKSSDLKDEIVHQLVTRAKGMFRWVSCQLDNLCELPTDALRRKALTSLPSTLNETYARVLTRIEVSARPLVRRTLQWIAYAERPGLFVEELSEIVAIDENDEELDPEACPDLDDLLRYCGSLVRKANSFYDSSARNRLELAHFTVQEFLEAINPNDTELNEFRLSSTDTLTLAGTCLNYLCLPSFDRPPSSIQNDLGSHPFYGHVSLYLFNYVDLHTHEEDLQKRLQKLFRQPKSYNLTRFVLHHLMHFPRMLYVYDDWIDGVCSNTFGSIHAAAMLRFERVCRWLNEGGCDVNQSSALGTPLELAVGGPQFKHSEPVVSFRHSESVSAWGSFHRGDVQRTILTLLEAGAAWNVDSENTESLVHAVSLGPPEVLLEALSYGMPLSTRVIERLKKTCTDDFMRNLLLVLDGVENADISPEVRMRLRDLARVKDVQLEAGLPINTRETMSDEMYAEAIVYTAKYGPLSSLLYLTTDERFSVNMGGSCRPATLLRMAVEHDSLECIELLLDKGFDAAHIDEFGRTVLYYAITHGIKKESLLRRLVGSNATEVVDRDGRSVWHIVAEKGRLDVLDILIASLGTDHPYSHMESDLGRTPLLEAILHQQSHIAFRILRSFPADTTFATDPRVVNSLVATGHEDLLRELVEMDAKIHTGCGQGQSALYFVTQKTTPGILKKLLDCGLNVDHLDSWGRTPLLDFLEVDQHWQRLEELLDSDFNCTNLDLSVIELLATPFSVITHDKESNSAWFYFCTKTIPSILDHQESSSEFDFLIGVSDILIQQGSLEAYQDAAAESGIALLIKTCLDNSSEIYMMKKFVKAIMGHILEDTTVSSLFVTHPQAVRLLIWSIHHSGNGIIEQLLRLGVDVHATSKDYSGDSAIDIAIEAIIEDKVFNLILAHADPHRIPKLDTEGCMRHFVLCTQPEPVKKLIQKMETPAATAISKLEAMFRRGVDPDAKDCRCITAAHVAASKGYLEPLKVLVAYHADLKLMNGHGVTVIHQSVISGNVAVVEYLRQVFPEQAEWERSIAFEVELPKFRDADLSPLPFATYHNCTLAHLAAYTGSPETLQFLRDNNVGGNVNGRTQEGATPLHFAVCTGSLQTARWLIENGADVNSKYGTRYTSVLHVAFRLGLLETSIALIEAGAQFSADSAGITPEMQVDSKICAELLELLPDVGVSIPPSVMEGIRPAAFNPGAIRILADHVLKHTRLFRISLPMATGTFDVSPSSILKAGLENHATDIDDVLIPEVKPGCSTLHVAVMSNNPDAIDLLLEYGVDSNVKDAFRLSPLHYAAEANSSILVEKLLKAGARPDAVDDLQKTPLMTAARVGATRAASVLVKHGANLAAVNYAGGTAMHYSAQGGSVEMFLFLLDSGCDPYQLDHERHSPVYYALSQSLLATSVYVRCLDLEHVVRADEAPLVGPGIHAYRSLLYYLSEDIRRSFLTMRTGDDDTVFIERAIYGGPDYVHLCVKAGARLETPRNNGDTALIAACRVGQLLLVVCLVRQGAKMEYKHRGQMFNAYTAACRHPEVIEWLLVKRWTEQGKLGSEPANSGDQVQCQPWTGVRTVKIPLGGDYERPEGSSLFDHAKYLHDVTKEGIAGWRILVPLGWDTVANLVPLPGEE